MDHRYSAIRKLRPLFPAAWGCALLFLALLRPSSAFADDLQEGEIRVKATAQVSAAPDLVDWVFRPSVLDKDPAKAFRDCDEKVTDILAKLKEFGIAQDDLQTPSVDITPEHEQTGGSYADRKFIGYRVTRVVAAKQRGLENFRKIFLAVTGIADANPQYTLASTNGIELRAKARAEAAKVARTKAEGMAAPLHAQVTRVVKIEEVEVGFMPSTNNFNFSDAIGGGAVPGTADNSVPFAPGLINESATLFVTFKIQARDPNL